MMAANNATDPASTRRFPRRQIKLPVLIATAGNTEIAVSGLATEISRSGMALYGGIHLQTGDLMEVEFPTPGHTRVTGVIRNRTGYWFGLEFLALGTYNVAVNGLNSAGTASKESPWVRAEWPGTGGTSLLLRSHEAYQHRQELEIEYLRQKTIRIRQLRRKIEALIQGHPLNHS